ncbi:MAG: nuclear transport factor 2 family protein [Gemmatimonadota bacterium]|nr:MAG: nuclear transport factor 2 family protein [Gemmatimonadota bacterium]
MYYGRIAALLAAFAIACNARGEIEQSTIPFDAQAAVEEWLAAWNTRDLGRIEGLFLADSSVSYLSSERGGLIQGPAAVREHHVSMGFVEGGLIPQQELWVEELRAQSYGSAAVLTGIWYYGDRAAPRDSVQRGPMTAVYVQADGGYRIAHMHFAEYR